MDNFFLNLNRFECCCKMFSNSDLCFGPCSTWAGVRCAAMSEFLVSTFDQFLQHGNYVGKGDASRIWPGLLDILYPNLKGVAQLSRKLALVCERAFAIRLRPHVKNLHFVEFWCGSGCHKRYCLLGLMELAWMLTSLRSTIV